MVDDSSSSASATSPSAGLNEEKKSDETDENGLPRISPTSADSTRTAASTASPLHVQLRDMHREPVPNATIQKLDDGFEYMEQWRIQFEERKSKYRQEIYDHHGPNKHTFISWALRTGVPDYKSPIA